jgi:hypothetical protein
MQDDDALVFTCCPSLFFRIPRSRKCPVCRIASVTDRFGEKVADKKSKTLVVRIKAKDKPITTEVKR